MIAREYGERIYNPDAYNRAEHISTVIVQMLQMLW